MTEISTGENLAGRSRRGRLLAVVIAAALITGCGGGDDDDAADVTPSAASDDAPSDASGESVVIVTFGDAAVSAPIAIPDDIPMPSDAEYLGENANGAPYSTAQFVSSIAFAELLAAVEEFAGSEPNARFDEAISQAVFERDIDGTRHTVYLWPKDLDQATLEVGILANPAG